MRIKFIQFFMVALCLYPAIAGAVAWDKPTDAEVAVLPPYCLAKFRGVDVKQWEDTLGSIYLHVHHYCGALLSANRYYKSSDIQDRNFYAQSIMNNLNYMIAHGEQSSALMPDIYLQRGVTLKTILKKPSEALPDLQKAIEVNPKLIRAYLVLAELYEELKQRDKALATVTEGLRQVPNNKSLKLRYSELGGKKPYPEPYAAPEAKQESAEAPVKIEEDALSSKAIQAKREEDAQAPKKSTETNSSSGAQAPAKIGTPGNPWCRFCAEESVSPPETQLPSTPTTAP